ncbi:AAA-domain-containing protein [Sparassis latifolia]
MILRQGAICELVTEELGLSGRSACAYQLAMTAPVLQGYAKKGVTRFYISARQLGGSMSNGQFSESPEVRSESDWNDLQKDGVEIDEDFLAGSVLHSMPGLSPRSNEGSPQPSSSRNSVEHDHPYGEKLHITMPEWTCTVEPLVQPVSPQWDDCTVYVRTSDLSRIAVLNGDWAVVRPRHGSSHRLVRVQVNEEQEETSTYVTAAPQLLYNILSKTTSINNDSDICLMSSPFGCRQPAIPMARAVTIARVASPFSTDRTYQYSFLRALQGYFKGTTRLVKQGDVITVKINTDDIQHQGEEDTSGEDGSDVGLESPCSSDNANEFIFFIVTNIEHNVVSNRGGATSPDLYVGSTVGELGCWVDPSVTRVIQTGVEHARVPDAALYLGISAPILMGSESLSSSLISPDGAFGKLLALTSAALNRNAVDYQLQLSILLQGPSGVGKYTVATWVTQRLGIHLYEVSCYDILGETPVKTEGTLRARFEKAASCSPCIFLLRHLDAFSQTTQSLEPGKEPTIVDALHECIAELQQSWNLTGFPVIVCATTSNPDRVSPRILSCFKHEVIFEAPGEAERYDILVSLLRTRTLAPDVALKDLAVQTAALVAADLVSFVSRAESASMKRAIQESNGCAEFDLVTAGIPLIAEDFDIALAESRASYSENIGAPKIPSVTWDDVGGLAHVKQDILDTIQLPLDHPELFADGLKKRSGILLYGPPGTGKTLLAKAVATSCTLNFFSVKGPELLNMYIGESEANVRRVFQRARDARPCVIFFDELDSVAPKRGSHGDSGGVMDRIVSQILAELDGLSTGKSGADVFVIGATNRPDLLDPALLRPGRFDRMLYLGVSTTHAAQVNILQALTRKFRLHPDLRLEGIAEQSPFHYTGADFYALCADALLKAMSRKAEELENTIAKLNASPPDTHHPYPLTPQYYLAELATPAETEVLVSEEDFTGALRELVPSVTQAEMEHYARIQQRFSKETINGAGGSA